MSLDPHAGRLRCGYDFRRGGVEVTHRDRHLEAESQRVLESSVGRDDPGARRHLQGGARMGRISP